MTNEDFDRHMTFMVEQQAVFAANLTKQQVRFDAFAQQQAEAWAKQEEWNEAWEKHRAEASVEYREQQVEAMARSRELDRKIDELAGFIGILRDALIGLTHHAERHEREMERHEREMGRHEREMADWVARGKETDARLNALILIVERHLSDHE